MTDSEQREAARQFINKWKNGGDEKPRNMKWRQASQSGALLWNFGWIALIIQHEYDHWQGIVI